MNINSFDCINDTELKDTALLLHIALTEPGKRTISQIAKTIGRSREYVNSLIFKCLDQTLFEFYLDDRKINNLEKTDFIERSNSDQNARLSVFSRAFFSDREDKAKYDELLKNYFSFSSVQTNRRELLMFHSSRLSLDSSDSETLSKIRDLLQKGKTIKCTLNKTIKTDDRLSDNPDEMSFYPCRIYNDIIENRRYFVGLSVSYDEWEIRFYPTDTAGISSKDEVFLKDIYPTDILKQVPDLLADVWGHQNIPFSEERMNIKAIIHDTSCLNKIIADISNYKNTLTKKDDGTNLMELEGILGYKGFITWVLSYGSSMEIMEPKKLRADIREIYKKVIEVYDDEKYSEYWKNLEE